MIKKLMLSAILLVNSNFALAALVDNGSYTTDTSSGLDWLDVPGTLGMPYNDVLTEFGAGGLFEGWRYATLTELIGFYDSAGGPGTYEGWDAAHNSWVSSLQSLWGLTLESNTSGDRTVVQFAEFNSLGQVAISLLIHDQQGVAEDYAKVLHGWVNQDNTGQNLGSALVRATINPVPIPAAAWLFGTAFLGLTCYCRRRRTA